MPSGVGVSRTKAVVYNTALSSDAFRVDRGVSAASSLTTGRGRRSEKLAAAAGQDQASFCAHMLLRILLSPLLLSLLLLCYCA